MVSKSYIVNDCTSNIIDDGDKCEKNEPIKNSEHMTRIDRYILHFSNEMVKLKPSNFFQDDNSPSKYWNNHSIIRWNKECLNGTKGHMSFAMLMKIVILGFVLVGFSYLLIAWLHPRSSPTNRHTIDQKMIVKLNTNLSITNSSMTEESTKITRLQKIAFQTSTQPSTNVISHDDDDVVLTKKYVSPTLPSIYKQNPTSDLPIQNDTNDNSCQSTSLPLCQGVLNYDLTDARSKWNLTNIEYQHFQHLLDSDCSKRVAEFVCHMLEPECRPSRMKHVKPCRRICKGIFESCSHIIASSEVLTEFFDCNTYIDSNDHSACEDITRFSKKCYEDEFRCSDYSCIPSKWRCDNIRDCSNGEDEKDCKFCNYDEFKCVSDKKCISDKWFCDGVSDCDDGSDEANCEVESEEDERSILYLDDKDYETSNSEHSDSDGDRLVSTGDGFVPIFVNPNVTNSMHQAATTTKTPKRFRSTMRKPATTAKPPDMTTMKKKQEIVKASSTSHVAAYPTSHASPCPEDELRCVDGLCINLDQICDKIQDCSDNSDELHCEY